jgi:8-oxo-dGTP pyrophosphatase MutT (NUDIX family)
MECPQVITREAAKGILYVPDGRIVVVAGKRGMFNLPGGGLDDGEMPHQAFMREVREELNLTESELTNVRAVGGTWGMVTPESGVSRRAVWHVFESELQQDVSDLTFSNEITAIDCLTVEEIKQHSYMSDLAKQAMKLVEARN